MPINLNLTLDENQISADSSLLIAVDDNSKSTDEKIAAAITVAVQKDTKEKNNAPFAFYKNEQPVLVTFYFDKNPETLNKNTKAIVDLIKSTKNTKLTLDTRFLNTSNAEFKNMVIAFLHSTYEFLNFKSKTKSAFTQITVIANKENADTFAYLNALNTSLSLCKDLANTPANVMTPSEFAEQATQVAKTQKNIDINIIDESEFAEIGMNAFLFVAKGSDENGKLIVLNYKAADENAPTYALVGKGVTFDTGGISLKPPGKMDEMKYDMCGAATVLSVLSAVAALELPINLVVACACAENMPSSKAGKPGDIVTSLSGKTIEVLNTDAEGRLVLCDAITYIHNKYKPNTLIDVATLTGACIVALGHQYAAMFSNNSDLAKNLMDASEKSHDPIWQLPLNSEFHKVLESPFADIGNIANAPGAGSATAACFLEKFCADDCNWAHLDIAGVAWPSFMGKQASGRPVRLLLDYLIKEATK